MPRAIVKSMYADIVYMLVGADESKMEEVREAMLSLTKGWQQDHVAQIVAETLDEVISPIVFVEALELFDEHHGAGARRRSCRRRRPKVRHAARTLPRRRRGHRHARPHRRRRCVHRRARVLRVRPAQGGRHDGLRRGARGVDLAESYAYSELRHRCPDAVGGRPSRRGQPGQGPGARGDRTWYGRSAGSRCSARLRDRVPVPPKGPTIAVGTVMAVAGVVVGGYVWWRRHVARGVR